VTLKWLSADGVRVDGPRGVLVERLTFASDGPHLAIVGGSSVLSSALAGLSPLARGALSIDGAPVSEARRANAIVHAPVDPRMPADWSPRQWTVWSARLCGMSAADATAAAANAIPRLGLAEWADKKLSTAPLAARRATSVAAALATGARTIVFDDPTVGLPDDVSRKLGRVVAEALDDVRWVWLTGRIPLASPLGLRVDDALLLGEGGVLAQGSPAEIASRDHVYTLRVSGPAQALAELARTKGAVAAAKDRELTVDLAASQTTHDLFVWAVEAGVTIVSLRPVADGVA